MAITRLKRSKGFTLIELMIVVAIIGILASVAIPSFLNYQLTSKRSEAYANLSTLARSQKAYFAEFGSFLGAAPQPFTSSGIVPAAAKRDSTPISASFANVGWEPEGDVFYDYDTATAAVPLLSGGCGTCTGGCFTSSAYGDLDGDGQVSVMIFAHPDQAGQTCATGAAFGGLGPYTAPVNQVGDPVLDAVAQVVLADRF